MYKKEIEYTDYNGNVRKETFWFHLTKAEITEMSLNQNGSMEKYFQNIVQSNDYSKLVKIFTELIKKSYGKKSDDGRRFMKSQEILDDFVQTEAYSQLFVELASDADAALAFCNGIMPSDMAMDPAQMKKEAESKMSSIMGTEDTKVVEIKATTVDSN